MALDIHDGAQSCRPEHMVKGVANPKEESGGWGQGRGGEGRGQERKGDRKNEEPEELVTVSPQLCIGVWLSCSAPPWGFCVHQRAVAPRPECCNETCALFVQSVFWNCWAPKMHFHGSKSPKSDFMRQLQTCCLSTCSNTVPESRVCCWHKVALSAANNSFSPEALCDPSPVGHDVPRWPQGLETEPAH